MCPLPSSLTAISHPFKTRTAGFTGIYAKPDLVITLCQRQGGLGRADTATAATVRGTNNVQCRDSVVYCGTDSTQPHSAGMFVSHAGTSTRSCVCAFQAGSCGGRQKLGTSALVGVFKVGHGTAEPKPSILAPPQIITNKEKKKTKLNQKQRDQGKVKDAYTYHPPASAALCSSTQATATHLTPSC